MRVRKRRVAIPFRVNSKEIISLVDLKKVLKEAPELLILPVEDGRLKRFLEGINKRLADLIDENNPQNSIRELGKALGIEVKNLEKTIESGVVRNSQELLKVFEKKPGEILLAKGTFEIEKLHVDFDTKIIGVGKNDTFLKVKVLSITSHNVEFENLSCEAKVLIGNPPKVEKEKAFYHGETKFFSENKNREPALIAVKEVSSNGEVTGKLLKGDLSEGKELNIISKSSPQDSGIYAFLGCGNKLKVIDITYPGSPEIVSILNLKEPIKKVVVHEKRAYVLKKSSFAVLDISNPKSIKIIGDNSVRGYYSIPDTIDVYKNYIFMRGYGTHFSYFYTVHTADLLVFAIDDSSRIRHLCKFNLTDNLTSTGSISKTEVIEVDGVFYYIFLQKEDSKGEVTIKKITNIDNQPKIEKLYSFSGQTLKDFTVRNGRLILLYDNSIRIRDILSGKLLTKIKLRQPYSNIEKGKDFVFLLNDVYKVRSARGFKRELNILILEEEKLRLEFDIKIDLYGEKIAVSSIENFICIADHERLVLIDSRTGKIAGEVKEGVTGIRCMALSKSPVTKVRVEKILSSDSSKSEVKLLLSRPEHAKNPVKEGDFLTDSAGCSLSKNFIAEVYLLEEMPDSNKVYDFFFEDTGTAVKGEVKSIEKEDGNIFRINVELQQTTIMDKNIKFEMKDQDRLIAIGVVR